MKIKSFLLVSAATLLFSSSSFAAGKFNLESKTIKNGEMINNDQVFNGFGCNGNNLSPDLQWQNYPKNTKSFALTVYDPDAPTGSGWWHWLVVNIPVKYHELPLGFGAANNFALKDKSQQIRNDFGIYNYGGPCPPKGDKVHRYIFTLHALKVEKLDLKEDATAALAGFMINANTIEKTSFTAFYSR